MDDPWFFELVGRDGQLVVGGFVVGRVLFHFA
jgi:hypothetical protein